MSRKSLQRVFSFMLLTGLLLGLVGPAGARTPLAQETESQMAEPSPAGMAVEVSDPVTPKVSPAVRDLPAAKIPRGEQREVPILNYFGEGAAEDTNTQNLDPLAYNSLNQLNTPAPLLSFEGMGNFGFLTPPDTTGDVGPNHYIQIVNVYFSIYDKAGNQLAGPTPNNALWAGTGTACEFTNNGDPIVLYDDWADRWLISQFSIEGTPQYECIAISQTPDPLGSYWLYAFPMPDFPDYPKFGVWIDGYYMSTNTGFPNAYYAHAFDRDNMLLGNPATVQSFGGIANFLMPADADGLTPPPAGSPEYFYTFYKNGYPDHPPGPDRIAIYEFDVDWVDPGNSNFTLVTEIPIAAFNYTVCGFFVQDCIPQPGTAQELDSLSYWPMVRLQYRNFGTYEAMVGNFTVDLDGTDKAAIRWFELRKSGANPWDLHQEGTYAPDSDHRWMGSIAMDGSGNIALGYSVSSTTTKPAIRYTVHEYNDPLGTMQAEVSLIEGNGVQTGIYRWGDYSAMNVDPTDQCTFWMTNEYHQADDSGWNWDTRIGAFKVPSCTGSLGNTGTLSGTVTDSSTSLPILGANVKAVNVITPTIVYNAFTNIDGEYDMTASVSVYTTTASAFGYIPVSAYDVEIFSGTVTTQDFALDPAASYLVEGTVTDVNTGWPLYAEVNTNSPAGSVWTDPVTGYYSITLPEGMAFNFEVSAWVAGYVPEMRVVGPLIGNTVEDFALDVDLVACNAPGYEYSYAYAESFEANDGGYTHSGAQDEWEWGTPVTWPGNCADGSLCWGTDLDGNYEDNANNSLVSPLINLSAYSAPLTAQWWQAWDIESATWDHAYAEVSINGGAYEIMWEHTGGTIQVDWTDFSYDISAAAGGNAQFRFRFTSDGSVTYNGYYIDYVRIPVACTPQPGGLVVGNVYEDNFNTPLTGAMIYNDSGGMTVADVTADPNVDDAFYTLFSPSGSHVFTATMTGYNDRVEVVNVGNQMTVGQDFFLSSGALVVDPTSLHVTLNFGAMATLPLTLTNVGTGAAYFEFSEKDLGYVPPPLKPYNGPIELDTDASYGQAPNTGEPVSIEAAPFVPLGSIGYSVDAAFGNFINFDLDVPEVLNTIAPFVPPNFPGAGEYVGDYVYVIEGTSMHELDPVTGADLGIMPVTPPGGGQSYTGMALDPTDGTVYLASCDISTSILWTLDMGTGTATQIGTITNSPCTIGIAIDGNGDLWGYDIVNDSLMFINKTTAVGTIIGPLGFDANFGQGMGWDAATDNIYLVAFNNGTFQPELRIADRATGSTTFVGILGQTVPGGTSQLPFLGLPIGVGADVPWLSENPISGTISAGFDQVIDVTFDASVVGQPGDYLAELNIASDTPYPDITVPVSMTVTPSPTSGKLQGTVMGLGNCDVNPMPLEDAVVVIESSTGITWTLQTDSNGYYSYWLDEAGNPYQVTVTYPEHEMGYVSGVIIVGQGTTTVDFDLRWLQPCLSANPLNMAVTLNLGDMVTLPMTLTNDGAAVANFEITEVDQGYILPPMGNVIRGSTDASSDDKQAFPTIVSTPVDMLNADVLLIQDLDAWGYPAITTILNNNGIPYDLINSSQIGSWDFLPYKMIIIPSVQGSGYYTNFNNNLTKFEDYISNGGLMLMSFCTQGETVMIPFGGDNPFNGQDFNYIVDPGHPIFAGVPNPYSGNWASHNNLSLLLPDDRVLVTTGSAPGGQPVMIERDAGVGMLVAGGQTFEFGWGNGQDAGIILENMIPWYYLNFQGAGDVVWLSENPISGTVSSDGGTQLIDVTFDATAIGQPGDYMATIKVGSDDPFNDPIDVPVTMTVNIPDTYGKLEGTVTSLGYCDLNPAPLFEESVLLESSTGITWTVVTDENGYYSFWLDEAGSPYTITVAPVEHLPGYAGGVVIVAGEITTVDFDLRWLAPCMSVDPDVFDVTVALGYSTTEVLELINAGAKETPFELREVDGGFTPGMLVGGVGEWLYQTEQGVPMLNNQGETVLAYPKAFRWTPDQPSQINVLIYADDYYHVAPNTFLDQALQALGIAYTAHYDADFFGFVNDLQSGTWDLVLVGNDNYLDTSIFSPLNDYVLTGGKLVINTWTMSWDPTNTFWTTLGVTWIADDYDPPDPVYWWDPSHPFFNDPEAVPELTVLQEFRYGTYGQQVEPLVGFEALAGYTTPGPDPNQAALVLGNDDTTVFKGFLDGQNDADLDSDGLMDGIELWINLINGLVYGLGAEIPWLYEVPVSGTVGADSSFFVDLIFDASVLTQTGDYTGMLQVMSDDEMSPIDVSLTLHVVEAFAPDVSFTVSPILLLDTPAMFTNTSNPGLPPTDEFLWDFGDGNTLTAGLEDVTHVYSDTGTFTVTLYAENVAGSDTATMVVNVVAEADLSIAKAASPDPVGTGEDLEYTLTVSNLGPTVAMNVVVVDTLPSGVTFVSASAGCAESAGVVTCDVGDLANGASVDLSIMVRAPDAPGTITNVAEVTSDADDPDTTNNTVSLDTTVELSLYMLYQPIINRND